LPRREAVVALRNRARLLEGRIALGRDLMTSAPDWMDQKPPHVSWMFELGTARAEVEIAWCLRVADRIEAGEGSHAGEVDPVEAGRLWREAIAKEFGPPVDEQ
jgi:hypothetical protein